MSVFENRVFEKLNEYNMLEGADTVVAALSGGADSMSLLHFLIKNASTLNIQVAAAHVNHNLRGEESLRDESFVRKECEKLGIVLYVKSLDIAALAKQRGLTVEECGRKERYAFFEDLRGSLKNCITATAHTASDNAETVIFNLTRGCGIDGLRGIPPVRQGIIRPLIGCTRKDVEDYCSENSIQYVTDSTNLSDLYSRNRIRLNVIPQLCMINPSAVISINRMSELAESGAALIHELAFEELERCSVEKGISIERLGQCRKGMLSHVLRLAIERQLDIVPEKRHIDLITSIVAEGHGAVELRKDKRVAASDGVLTFVNGKNADNDICKFTDIPFSPEISFIYNGKRYVISKKIDRDNSGNPKINKKLLINCLSCDIITYGTVIRNRKSYDVFAPYGRGCTKTVKKLFTEMKLPQHERESRLLIANGNSVLWIEGVGVSQEAAPKENDEFYEVRVYEE